MLRQGSKPWRDKAGMETAVNPRIKMQLRLTSAPASEPRSARILRFAPTRPVAETITPRNAPERMMLVEFEGLTAAEQRLAVSTFPGGSRFVLGGSALS